MNWILLGGSVAGVLALVAVAWWLGLGGGAIADEAQARQAAEESQTGFVAEEAIVSSDGKAALVRGGDGDFILLKVHGVHVAARRLAPPLSVRTLPDGAIVASGERMFGDVRLSLSAEQQDKLRTMV